MRRVCAWFMLTTYLSTQTKHLVLRSKGVKHVPLDISSLIIDGNIISRVKSAKSLVIMMDGQLNFIAHVEDSHRKFTKYIHIV